MSITLTSKEGKTALYAANDGTDYVAISIGNNEDVNTAILDAEQVHKLINELIAMIQYSSLPDWMKTF